MIFKKEREGTIMSKIIKILSILALFISGASYADIKFWTTEVQPARMEKQDGNG